MSLETSPRLISLRAMAHPTRLRILSLTGGAALSAAELAEELGIQHAAASYHARQLADAGLLTAEEASDAPAGPGRPPTRYRYVPVASDALDCSEAPDAVWPATSAELQRRLRAQTRHRVAADAEVWMEPADFERVCDLAAEISDLIHTRARPPRAAGTVHGSVSVFTFELGDDS